MVADLDLSASLDWLIRRRFTRGRSCVIEAQDFYDNDTKMTFTCYEPGAVPQ